MALSAEPMINQPTRAKDKQDFARMRLGRTELDSPAKTVHFISIPFFGVHLE
jgi:hypothetical protein